MLTVAVAAVAGLAVGDDIADGSQGAYEIGDRRVAQAVEERHELGRVPGRPPIAIARCHDQPLVILDQEREAAPTLGYPTSEPRAIDAHFGYACRVYRANGVVPIDTGIMIFAVPETVDGAAP
jgi:hypothetical protein